MKTIVIAITLAIVLGVAVMLVPVLAFTYVYSATVPLDRTGPSEGKENNQSVSTTDGADGTGSYSLEITPAKIVGIAQDLGTLDADSAPFPSSILQVVPVVAVGFVTALAVFIILKWKSSQT